MSSLDPLGYLSPAEREEVESLNNYLREHAKTDFRNMPERTVAAVMNKASPNARFFMNANRNVVTDLDESGGRYKPFDPKMDIAATVPKEAKPILDRVATEDLTTSLNSRMGTSTPDEPTSLRDIVDAAFDHHEGSTND